jgi:hypothetical protein
VAVLAAAHTAGSPCSGSPCPGYTCLPQQRHLRLRMGLLIEEVAVAGSTGHPCQCAGEGDPCRGHGGDGLRSFARVRKSKFGGRWWIVQDEQQNTEAEKDQDPGQDPSTPSIPVRRTVVVVAVPSASIRNQSIVVQTAGK